MMDVCVYSGLKNNFTFEFDDLNLSNLSIGDCYKIIINQNEVEIKSLNFFDKEDVKSLRYHEIVYFKDNQFIYPESKLNSEKVDKIFRTTVNPLGKVQREVLDVKKIKFIAVKDADFALFIEQVIRKTFEKTEKKDFKESRRNWQYYGIPYIKEFCKNKFLQLLTSANIFKNIEFFTEKLKLEEKINREKAIKKMEFYRMKTKTQIEILERREEIVKSEKSYAI